METSRGRWRSILTEGIALIILGLIAIIIPQLFAFGVELIIGIVLIISALVMGYRAFGAKRLPESLLLIFMGVIALITGILLLVYPWKGLLAITVILTLFFAIDGLSKLFFAATLRSTHFWTWYVLSGLISLALAIIVWIGWPNSSYWLLGLLVGINLIFFGCARIALALAMR